MFNPAEIVRILNEENVDYVLIGGLAATLYGCPEQTFDLDILFEDSESNRLKLVKALHRVGAQWDEPITTALLSRQPLFALNSPLGDVDIFRAIPGLASFAAAKERARVFQLQGQHLHALSLADLIASKEAAADPNPRKQSALIYLKALHAKTPAGP